MAEHAERVRRSLKQGQRALMELGWTHADVNPEAGLDALVAEVEQLRGERGAAYTTIKQIWDALGDPTYEALAGQTVVELVEAAVRAGGEAAALREALEHVQRVTVGGSDQADVQDRLDEAWRIAREALASLDTAEEQTP